MLVGNVVHQNLDVRHVEVDRHVVLGERCVHDASAPFVEQRVFAERHADAHHDAAAQLTGCRLRVDDPAAVEGSQPARHADFARVLSHPHLAELRAE